MEDNWKETDKRLNPKTGIIEVKDYSSTIGEDLSTMGFLSVIFLGWIILKQPYKLLGKLFSIKNELMPRIMFVTYILVSISTGWVINNYGFPLLDIAPMSTWISYIIFGFLHFILVAIIPALLIPVVLLFAMFSHGNDFISVWLMLIITIVMIITYTLTHFILATLVIIINKITKILEDGFVNIIASTIPTFVTIAFAVLTVYLWGRGTYALRFNYFSGPIFRFLSIISAIITIISTIITVSKLKDKSGNS